MARTDQTTDPDPPFGLPRLHEDPRKELAYSGVFCLIDGQLKLVGADPKAPKLPANFAWGDADGRTLYLTARTGLYRMRLGIPGTRP